MNGDRKEGGTPSATEPLDQEYSITALEVFGPIFVKLAQPVWKTQAAALRVAKWMR